MKLKKLINLLFFLYFFICGILTSLLFPPFFLTPIGFVVLPCIFFLLQNKQSRISFKLNFLYGFIYGIGFFTIFLIWIKEPFFLNDTSKPYAIFSYLLIIYCSLYFGLVISFIKFFKNEILKLFMLPALIVLAEYICANFSYGFPWFSFALINSNNIVGMTLIYYFGTAGLSYLTILIFLFPGIFIFKNKEYFRKSFLIYIFIFLMIIILIFTKTIQEKNQNKKIMNTSISLVQLNNIANSNSDLENKNIKLQKIIDIIKKSQSDIIIFAENDYPFLMDSADINLLQNFLSTNKLIIGSSRKERSNYFNSFFLINKNNYQKFDKQTLVPFGEFVPFRKYLGFMEFIAGSMDFSKGSDDRVINLYNDINIMPIICYEIIYYWDLIKTNNTNIIINLTNDSWFGKLFGPYQHFYFTKLRAAEFNKSVLRVSNNGISGLIDNNGSIEEYINLNEEQIKKIDVKIGAINENNLILHKIFFLIIVSTILFGIYLNNKDEQRSL